jgi:DNA-binding response OmpR family regulator
VDLQTPGEDSISFCKQVRSDALLKNVPLLMISGNSGEDFRVECFTWGADDFIAKPYTGRELMSRILAKLCWTRELRDGSIDAVTDCGNLSLDEKKLQATVEGDLVELTVFEFRLLRYFIDHRESVVPRARLFREVWNGKAVSSRTVDTHVCTLRQKLKGFSFEFHTVHGAGYMLRPRAGSLEYVSGNRQRS